MLELSGIGDNVLYKIIDLWTRLRKMTQSIWIKSIGDLYFEDFTLYIMYEDVVHHTQ